MRALRRAPAAAAAARARLVAVLVLRVVLVGGGRLGLGLRGGLLGGFGLLLGAAGLLGLELGGDQRVVLGAQVDLVVEVDGAVRLRLVGLELVLALERGDLLRR